MQELLKLYGKKEPFLGMERQTVVEDLEYTSVDGTRSTPLCAAVRQGYQTGVSLVRSFPMSDTCGSSVRL
jgi:hypothetical protein